MSPEQLPYLWPIGSAAGEARNGQCQVGQPLASRLGETVQKDVPVDGFVDGSMVIGSMGYFTYLWNLLGIYLGYKPCTKHLLFSWDMQVPHS